MTRLGACTLEKIKQIERRFNEIDQIREADKWRDIQLLETPEERKLRIQMSWINNKKVPDVYNTKKSIQQLEDEQTKKRLRDRMRQTSISQSMSRGSQYQSKTLTSLSQSRTLTSFGQNVSVKYRNSRSKSPQNKKHQYDEGEDEIEQYPIVRYSLSPTFKRSLMARNMM
ncbi:MAG: hypothetical protein EZS28_001334 [Streblomastix strix]|uniref:Uncharacterized protein n=1 Tax=Streblomastix strix TaxID=222440 RepID=A0A5J4X8N6_9EUKA|nr:MAG: hypothetical protein EZS28_001334 [Streblomastix strix]